MSKELKSYLDRKGIHHHQCTMIYSPKQNGVAKRKNRSLMEMAMCMLKAKGLSHKFQMEEIACAGFEQLPYESIEEDYSI